MFLIPLFGAWVPITVLIVLHVLWTRKQRNLSVLIGYLASITSRGYPLAGGLQALADTTGGSFAEALRGISDRMRMGMSLSGALLKCPRLMPADYLDLIHSGETAGRVADVFQVLKRHGRRAYGRRARLFALAAYPLFLFWILGLTGLLFFTLILPMFQEIANSFGISIPDSLLRLPVLWQIAIPIVFALTLLIVMLAVPSSMVLRREGHLGFIDSIKWWLPVSRQYEKHQGIKLFAQSLQIQLHGGVPFRDALRLACEVAVIAGVRKRLRRMEAAIDRGESLSRAAAECRLFPARSVYLLAMGETSGNILPALEEMTSGSLDACDRIANWAVLVAVPVAVILVGAGVASLGGGMFKIFADLMNSLQGG